MDELVDARLERDLRSPVPPMVAPIAIAFLASSDASYVTGAELYVDGGFTAW